MADESKFFRQLASNDMVRRAAQRHERLQPIPNDDRIQSLLERLSEAERVPRRAARRTRMRSDQLADRLLLPHMES